MLEIGLEVRLRHMLALRVCNTWVARDEIMGSYPWRNCWEKTSRMFEDVFHEDVYSQLQNQLLRCAISVSESWAAPPVDGRPIPSAISSSGGADFSLSAVDITDAGNEDLLDRYKHDIPVVHKEGAYWFKHRLPFDGDGERIAREIEREGVNPVGSKPDASRLSKPKSTSSKTSTVTIPLPGYKTTYTVLTPGSGSSVTKGRTVTVHATGVVKETGEKFWSTKDAGQVPFTYAAGVGAVITGW